MKGIYVAIASLVLAAVLLGCFAVGAMNVPPIATHVWQMLGIILACCIVGVLLIDWARRFFYLGRPSVTALRESVESILTAIWQHSVTIGVTVLMVFVVSVIIFGAVVITTTLHQHYVLAMTAQSTIDELRSNMAATEAKLQELESRVKELTQENEALLATVKKAARAGVAPSRGNVSRSTFGQYLGRFECTAYNPVVWQCDSTPHITATGNRVRPGYTVAIDPQYWEFGTRFYVSGIGEVVADDTGAKVKGRNRLDLCVGDLRFARELGRWWADVWLMQ